MTNREKVLNTAQNAREICNKYAVKDGGYSDLGGYCSVASNFLFTQLTKQKIKTKLAWNGNHCFNLVYLEKKWHILDITATQFGHKSKIILKPLLNDNKTPRKCYYWDMDYETMDPKGYWKEYKLKSEYEAWAVSPSNRTRLENYLKKVKNSAL